MTATKRIFFRIPVLRLRAIAPASAVASGAMGGGLSGQAAVACRGDATGMNQTNEGSRHRAGRRAM